MDDHGTVTPPSPARRSTRVALLAGGVALLLGALLLREQGDSRAARLAPERARTAAIAVRPVAQPEQTPAVQRAPVAPEAAADATEPAGYDPKRHAHPITAEHLRMYREDDLLDSAWHALRRRDFRTARELVATHQGEYPGSKEHMDEGLLLLADCTQRPGTETKARAQAFYDTKTYSPMRRRLRRLCLELPD